MPLLGPQELLVHLVSGMSLASFKTFSTTDYWKCEKNVTTGLALGR